MILTPNNTIVGVRLTDVTVRPVRSTAELEAQLVIVRAQLHHARQDRDDLILEVREAHRLAHVQACVQLAAVAEMAAMRVLLDAATTQLRLSVEDSQALLRLLDATQQAETGFE